MAKEAELVKLPTEAPVVSARGAPLLAPRRGDRDEGSHSTWGAQRPSWPHSQGRKGHTQTQIQGGGL